MLALRHGGEWLTTNLAQHRLDFGDMLLIAGGWDDISRLREDREDFVVLALSAEYQERLPARRRAPVAIAILAMMVVAMASGLIHLTAAALLVALAMLATRCVPLDAIYRVISWKTLVLVAGMMPLTTALNKTGITAIIAHGMVTALGSAGPIAMLVVVFLVAALDGLFLSNAATTMLIAPVAIEAAQTLHVSPEAFAMTVVISCSASFVTPVSSTWNLLVMEPGGYTFGDYIKVGLPLLRWNPFSALLRPASPLWRKPQNRRQHRTHRRNQFVLPQSNFVEPNPACPRAGILPTDRSPCGTVISYRRRKGSGSIELLQIQGHRSAGRASRSHV